MIPFQREYRSVYVYTYNLGKLCLAVIIHAWRDGARTLKVINDLLALKRKRVKAIAQLRDLCDLFLYGPPFLHR